MNSQQMNKRPRKPLSPNDVYAILSPHHLASCLACFENKTGGAIYACDVATIGRALYDNDMTRVREISEGGRHG